MPDERKIYRSKKQSYYKGTNDPVEVRELRIITIEGDKFTLELPDNSELKGTLTFKVCEDNSAIYETDHGCPFVISPDAILVNLMGFNETAINYLLEPEDGNK